MPYYKHLSVNIIRFRCRPAGARNRMCPSSHGLRHGLCIFRRFAADLIWQQPIGHYFIIEALQAVHESMVKYAALTLTDLKSIAVQH